MLKNLTSAIVLALALGPSPALAQGKFLTAAEVKPILDITKGSWIAIAATGNQDLLYFTHLLAWRCGLSGLQYSINGSETLETWPLTPCIEDGPTPAAIGPDQPIYMVQPIGSIQTVTILITYDDDTTDQVSFERKSVLLP